MARRCELTGTGVQSGNNVSHSNRKTRRRFLPNLQEVSFISNILKKVIKLRVTAATLRSVDHNSGIDGYLVSTPSKNLSAEAQKLRRQVKKAIAATGEAPKKEKKAAPKKAVRPKASKKAEKAPKAAKPAKKAAAPKKKAAKKAE